MNTNVRQTVVILLMLVTVILGAFGLNQWAAVFLFLVVGLVVVFIINNNDDDDDDDGWFYKFT